MTDEDFEFLMTQYLDGTLSSRDAAAVEKRLASDPHAQAQLDEYRRLSQALHALPGVPEMRWDFLADQISQSVAGQPLPRKQPGSRPKLHSFFAARTPPVFMFRRPLAWVGAAGALAACVLLGMAIPAFLSTHQWAANNDRQNHSPQSVTRQDVALQNAGSADVTGPQVETADGPAVADVQILLPAQATADSENFPLVAEGIVRQPTHISIASVATPDAISPQ